MPQADAKRHVCCKAGDLQWQLYDMLRNRNEWWVPGKLVEIRQRLEPYWRVRLLFTKFVHGARDHGSAASSCKFGPYPHPGNFTLHIALDKMFCYALIMQSGVATNKGLTHLVTAASTSGRHSAWVKQCQVSNLKQVSSAKCRASSK